MKKINSNYICSALYGIFGSLGLHCLVFWYAMAVFNESHKYPYLTPFSISAGFVSLIICISAFVYNINCLIKEKNKFKTIIKEILLTIILFIAFIYIWGYLIEFTGNLF